MGTKSPVVDALPRWAYVVLGFIGVIVAAAVVAALWQPDSPWCDDTDGAACPTQVRYADRMYDVECAALIAATSRDVAVTVRYHSGGGETTRQAWTVEGVATEDLLVLGDSGSECDGTEIAFGESLSGTERQALLRGLG